MPLINLHNYSWVLKLRIIELLKTKVLLLKGHPDERPTPLFRPLDNVIYKHKCTDFYP